MCGLKYFSSTTMFTTFNGYWTHANVWLVPVKLHLIVFYGTSLLMSSYCLSVIYHEIKVNYNCMHMHKSLCVSNRAELIRFKNTFHDSLATSLCDGTLPFYDQRHIKLDTPLLDTPIVLWTRSCRHFTTHEYALLLLLLRWLRCEREQIKF